MSGKRMKNICEKTQRELFENSKLLHKCEHFIAFNQIKGLSKSYQS